MLFAPAVLITALCCGVFQFELAAALPISFDVLYSEYLKRSDLVWEWNATNNLPTKWYHSAFIGNGALGMMVRVNETDPTKSLLFVVSSSAVWDDREKDKNYSLGNNFVYDRPRLPVGQFYLTTVGDIVKGQMRLDLYNAVVTGHVETTEGILKYGAWIAVQISGINDVLAAVKKN